MNRILWKKVSLVGIILIGLLLILAGSVCSADTQIRFTDAMGRDIILDKPAERIGFTSYMIAESIKLAGAWDKVVARDGYISDPVMYPGFDTIPAISSTTMDYKLDFEKIIEIKPDVMIVPIDKWGTYSAEIQQVIDQLEPEIPVIFLNLNDPITFAENLEKLGKVCGTSRIVEEYLSFYNGIFEDISSKTSLLQDKEKPIVFFKAAGWTVDQLCTFGGKEELINQIADITGFRSLSKSLKTGWTEVDPEWLVGQDMDVILVQAWDMHYPETFGYLATNPAQKYANAQKIIDEVSAMDLISQTSAVNEGNVYLIHDPLIGTPRFIVGIAYIAKWMHPDLFTDLNPEQVHRDYLRYIGADYDLNSVGLAAYP